MIITTHFNESFDALAFARRGKKCEGVLVENQVPRLATEVDMTHTRLTYHLRGEEVQDKLFLVLDLSGEVMLKCDRCLQSLPWPLNRQVRFLLVPEGASWPEEDALCDDYDAITVSHNLDWLALIEDEALLSLPMAPRHARCQASYDLEQDKLGAMAMAWQRLKDKRNH